MDTKIAGYWERYEARPPRRTLPFEDASNLRIPLTMWVINGILVRFMRTVFGQKPWLAVSDEDNRNAPDAADLERMTQHLAEVEMGLRSVEWQWFLNALVEGTGVL